MVCRGLVYRSIRARFVRSYHVVKRVGLVCFGCRLTRLTNRRCFDISWRQTPPSHSVLLRGIGLRSRPLLGRRIAIIVA